MASAYVLRSLRSGRFYYGSTGNLEERLKNHNAGKVRSTKAYRPWVVHYVEHFKTRGDAYRRELFFKSINGHNWLREQGIIDRATVQEKTLQA